MHTYFDNHINQKVIKMLLVIFDISDYTYMIAYLKLCFIIIINTDKKIIINYSFIFFVRHLFLDLQIIFKEQFRDAEVVYTPLNIIGKCLIITQIHPSIERE